MATTKSCRNLSVVNMGVLSVRSARRLCLVMAATNYASDFVVKTRSIRESVGSRTSGGKKLPLETAVRT